MVFLTYRANCYSPIVDKLDEIEFSRQLSAAIGGSQHDACGQDVNYNAIKCYTAVRTWTIMS